MGVEFSGLDTPSTEMTLRTYVYFDGLTKNEFVQKVLLTIRALSLAVRTFIRALEEQSRSEELDPSSAIRAFIRTLEEDSSTEETTPSSSQLVLSSENRTLSRDEVKELMRRVPQTYGSLTMAS